MISGQISLIHDDRIDAAFARLKTGLSPVGFRAVFEEIGRRVSAIDWITYPPQSHAPMADLWTDAQRRYFWAAKARGEIDLPYERTRDLAKSLETILQFEDYTLNVTVRVDPTSRAADYAEDVIGINQSRYFRERTEWEPLPQMAAKQEQEVLNAILVVMADLEEILNLG